MHKRSRELIDYSKKLGYVLLPDKSSRGHYVVALANGRTVEIPSSPGELRGDANCRAQLRRVAGAEHDGPNSGHHRKGVGRKASVRHLASDAEVDKATRVRRLVAEHQSICGLFRMVQDGTATEDDREMARGGVRRIVAIEAELGRLGASAPRIDIRF